MTFDTAFEKSHPPNTMTDEKNKAPATGPIEHAEKALEAARAVLDTVRRYNESSGSSIRLPLPEVIAILIRNHLSVAAAEPRECRWATMPDGVSNTTCENGFEFSEGTPQTNGFQFCPFCGGAISQSIVFNDGGELKRAKERGFQ